MPEIIIGEDGVRLYQALVTRQGLKACKIGLRLNKAYTPTNCLRTATLFTGKTYKPRTKGELDRAIEDMNEVIDKAKSQISAAEEEDCIVIGTEQQPWADPMPETPMPDGPA